MKIGFTGLDLREGKFKYEEDIFLALIEKVKPRKVSPCYLEFIRDDLYDAEVLVVPSDKVLDLLLPDMEKAEKRIERSGDDGELGLMKRALALLEEETPLSEGGWTEEEFGRLKDHQFLTIRPTLLLEGARTDPKTIAALSLEKAGYLFFYTAGPKEVHAWLVRAGSDIVACAGKIHTDLAEGFIRADVCSPEGFLESHNMNDARKRGFVEVVDRDYIIRGGEIIEIRSGK